MADTRRDEPRREDLGEELPRNQEQHGATHGGRQAGGGPGPSDMGSAGGSSGSGGYGMDQEQQTHHAGAPGPSGRRSDESLDRGERFDELQGGGRGDDKVTVTAADLAESPRRHAGDDESENEAEVEGG